MWVHFHNTFDPENRCEKYDHGDQTPENKQSKRRVPESESSILNLIQFHRKRNYVGDDYQSDHNPITDL